MGDDEIAVRVTAQINGLVDGMGEAVQTVRTGAGEIEGSFQVITKNFGAATAEAEGATVGFGRLERSLSSLVISATGADPHLGHVAAIIASMSINGEIMVGALLGLGAIALLYEKVSEAARGAAKEQEEVLDKLLKAAKLREAGGEGAQAVNFATSNLTRLQAEEEATRAMIPAIEDELGTKQKMEAKLAKIIQDKADAQREFDEALAEEGKRRQEIRDIEEKKTDAGAKKDAAEQRQEFEELIRTGLALAKGEISKDANTKKEIDKWQAQWNKAIAKVTSETRALPGEMGALVNKETESDLVTAQMKLQRVLNQTQRSIETVIGGVMAVSDAAFARWVTGAATIGQTFSELSRQILLSMIHSIERAFEVWLATEIMKRTIGAKTAKQSILHDAYGAAASAFHSTAGIPFVGPILAPLAAAAAFAAVAAFGSGIASAAGGFDIPSGVNPMTQLHAREMVLPASLADGIRGMIAGGGGGGGVTVYAMDAKSFQDYLHTNRDSLVPALRTLARSGAL